ncbi:hypothetical protein [Actinomyces viscosus]|uniref:hypothetical protein n=1 Tax=Actinomyces viscosus TaxID=1656 RepID=UPI0028F0CD88|nr:hypothetical protein [Actinomyces viscosus]
MSSSPAEASADTRVVPRAVVVRAVLTVALSALLTGALFSYFYIEVFNAPTPHRLPVAVAGTDSTHLQDAVGDGYRLIPVTHRQEGLGRLSRHEVYGVITVDAESRSVELAHTSVDGSSVLAYMQPVAERVSERSGMTLRITNTTPGVAANASPGRSVFFAVFGTALTGFVLSQALSSVASQVGLSLRATLAIMVGVSAVAGLLVSLMLDPWFGIASGTFWSSWPMVSLLCLSAVTTGSALLDLVGPLGQVVTAVLFVTLGNATATGILPMPFLTRPYQVISRLIPTGNVVRAVLDRAYFSGAGTQWGYIVPLAWIVAGIGLLTIVDRRRVRSRRA